jgi:selenium metabolism protein YedF
MSHDITLDVRGRPCPEPVLETRRALDAGARSLVVVVDSDASCENVGRMARSMGCEVSVETEADGALRVCITAPQGGAGSVATAAESRGTLPEPETDRSPRSGTVVLIASDRLGSGSDDLGWVIMRVFVKTLRDVAPRPDAIILLNGGVKLATEGSELVGHLADLERDGSEVIACGTCLDYFELRDQLRVGRVTNMLEIVTKLSNADRVIRP